MKHPTPLLRTFFQRVASLGKFNPKGGTYENWNGSDGSKVRRFIEPTGNTEQVEKQIGRVIEEAIKTGQKVRFSGCGHNFNDIVNCSDLIVSMDRCSEILSFSAKGDFCEATVQSGAKVYELIDFLASQGYMLSNLGNYNQQTIAGVLATATHGTTGKVKQSLYDNVTQIRMIDGTGKIVSSLPKHLWCHVGVLGCVTEVTLRCPRLYLLEKTEEWIPFEELIENREKILSENDFAMFKAQIYGSFGRLVKFNKTNKKGKPKIWYYLKSLYSYVVMPRVSIFFLRPLKRWISRKNYRTLLNRLYRLAFEPTSDVQIQPYVLTTTFATAYHMETEWAVEREQMGALLADLREAIEKLEESYMIELHIRFSDPSTVWLDPAFGRKTVWFDLNIFRNEQFYKKGLAAHNKTPIMEVVNRVMRQHHARPHWAKAGDFNRDDIAPLYPHYHDFLNIRREFDPHQIFSTPYTKRVFNW